MAFGVLFVCTGNICRSPMAERLFAARMKDAARAEVTVSSAGTRAVRGHGIDAPSASVLRDLGGDPNGHEARQLDDEVIRTADLVLTASSSHRAVILGVEPKLMRRTFTLREFARLVGGLPPRRPGPAGNALTRRVDEAAAGRGLGAAEPPSADEIADPFGAGMAEARRTGEQISAAVDEILAGLGLHRS